MYVNMCIYKLIFELVFFNEKIPQRTCRIYRNKILPATKSATWDVPLCRDAIMGIPEPGDEPASWVLTALASQPMTWDRGEPKEHQDFFQEINFYLPSLKLTNPLKIDPWKFGDSYILETIIFRRETVLVSGSVGGFSSATSHKTRENSVNNHV